MNALCKNCAQPIEGKYCSNCSQATDTHRLNFHSIWEDVRHGLLHFSEELVFTSKQLFTRPGHTIREYIEGKRINHFSPISFVIFVASMYGVLAILLNIHVIEESSAQTLSLKQMKEGEINHWIISHYSWVALFTIPLFAGLTFSAFKKQDYNFAEHIIINAFLTGQQFLFLIALLPLSYWVDNSVYIGTYRIVVLFIEFMLRFWSLSQLFTKASKLKIAFLLMLCYLFFFIIVGVLAYLFVIVIR